jgi:hypothetical protein
MNTNTSAIETAASNLISMSDKIQVGKETLACLKCLQLIERLNKYMWDALLLHYGEDYADKIMGEEYFDKIEYIQDMINRCMCSSIIDNLLTDGEITEI